MYDYDTYIYDLITSKTLFYFVISVADVGWQQSSKDTIIYSIRYFSLCFFAIFIVFFHRLGYYSSISLTLYSIVDFSMTRRIIEKHENFSISLIVIIKFSQCSSIIHILSGRNPGFFLKSFFNIYILETTCLFSSS